MCFPRDSGMIPSYTSTRVFHYVRRGEISVVQPGSRSLLCGQICLLCEISTSRYTRNVFFCYPLPQYLTLPFQRALKRKRYMWVSIYGTFSIMSKMRHSFVQHRKDFILQGSILSLRVLHFSEHIYATIYMSGLQLIIMMRYTSTITTGKSVISNNGTSCSVVNMHMRMVDYGCTCVMQFPARISVQEFAYVHLRAARSEIY